MQRITSKDNQKIKLLSKLISSQKERDESGLFVLEGLRLIADAISAGLKILELYVAESYLGKAEVEIFALLPESVEIIAIDDFILPKITDTKTPQGIVALAQGSLLEENLPESMAGGALLLCGLQDPGNMGTLLRSAAAFSLSAVIITENCPHITSPKVLRASMGGAFNIPIISYKDEFEALSALTEKGIATFAAYLSPDSVEIQEVDLKGACVAIGNEGNGICESFAAACSQKIIIPIDKNSESLNAAVAGSLIAWEIKRAVAKN